MSSVRSELDAIDRYLSKNCLDDDFPTESIYGALSTFEEQEKEIATLTAKLAESERQAFEYTERVHRVAKATEDAFNEVTAELKQQLAQAMKALEAIAAMKDTESDEWDAVERLIPEMVEIASKAISANK